MDRYEVAVKLPPTPPGFEALEFTYVLKAESPEETEAIVRRRLMRGPFGRVPHADWKIDVKKGAGTLPHSTDS
jgi:hypothetical protein